MLDMVSSEQNEQNEIEAYTDIAKDFLSQILDVEYEDIYLTDITDLTDFNGYNLPDEVQEDIDMEFEETKVAALNEDMQESFYDVIHNKHWDEFIINKIDATYGVRINDINEPLYHIFEKIRYVKVYSLHPSRLN